MLCKSGFLKFRGCCGADPSCELISVDLNGKSYLAPLGVLVNGTRSPIDPIIQKVVRGTRIMCKLKIYDSYVPKLS